MKNDSAVGWYIGQKVKLAGWLLDMEFRFQKDSSHLNVKPSRWQGKTWCWWTKVPGIGENIFIAD